MFAVEDASGRDVSNARGRRHPSRGQHHERRIASHESIDGPGSVDQRETKTVRRRLRFVRLVDRRPISSPVSRAGRRIAAPDERGRRRAAPEAAPEPRPNVAAAAAADNDSATSDAATEPGDVLIVERAITQESAPETETAPQPPAETSSENRPEPIAEISEYALLGTAPRQGDPETTAIVFCAIAHCASRRFLDTCAGR